MLLYAKKILHNLTLVNWHYWLQILSYHKNFWIGLVIFQLVSFTSNIYVYPEQIAYGKKKYSENGLYEAVFAYIFRMYRYKHDKENIFANLVKSALNI